MESGENSNLDHPLLAPEEGHARAPRGAKGDTSHHSGALIWIKHFRVFNVAGAPGDKALLEEN